MNGHEDVVSALIKAGANVNEKDDRGNTALIYAAGKGHIAIVNMLLDAHASANALGLMSERKVQIVHTS
jgi:ankyrin repeat protein